MVVLLRYSRNLPRVAKYKVPIKMRNNTKGTCTTRVSMIFEVKCDIVIGQGPSVLRPKENQASMWELARRLQSAVGAIFTWRTAPLAQGTEFHVVSGREICKEEKYELQ